MRRVLGVLVGSALALPFLGALLQHRRQPWWCVRRRWTAGLRRRVIPPVVPVASNDPYCNGSVNFVTGPATPPLGVGSAELKTGNGTTGGDCSAELRNSAYSGVKLSSLTALSYWTYDVANNGSQFPYLELNIDTTGTGAAPNDALFFEPPFQSTGNGGADCAHQANTAMNTWQQWDALHGCWWSNYGDLNAGTGTGTLADYLAVHPNATIVNSSSGGGVHLVVGFASPTDQFDGNVDAFTINSTTYDFEPSLPSPTSKDQCKNGGWHNYADANGTAFKNQGDCVSYVATRGRNPGNG